MSQDSTGSVCDSHLSEPKEATDNKPGDCVPGKAAEGTNQRTSDISMQDTNPEDNSSISSSPTKTGAQEPVPPLQSRTPRSAEKENLVLSVHRHKRRSQSPITSDNAKRDCPRTRLALSVLPNPQNVKK